MNLLIDTNIAIHIREGDSAVVERFARLRSVPSVSIVTMVELYGGVAAASPELKETREVMTRAMTSKFTILPFDADAAKAYLAIVTRLGFSRNVTLDRMIAATAIAVDATLITINVRDFRDVPGLRLEDWSQ